MTTTIKKLHEDFLSCIICTDLYRDPCTLACGHTFCRGCLVKFARTQQEAIKAKSILCPNCRQMTAVSNPSRSIEDWVKQIKPSFLIQGLLDDFAVNTEGTEGRAAESLCFSCKQSEVKTTSSSYCIDCDVSICTKCAKGHKAMPSSSHHDITDLPAEGTFRRRRKVRCQKHNSIVEFCCKDCCKAICQKCCILDHRKCDSVVTIESMVPEMKSVLFENKNKLTLLVKMDHSKLARKQSKVTEIEAQKIQIHSEITDVCQSAINLIKQKEQQLIREMGDISQTQIRELKDQMKAEEIDMQMHQQHLEFINQALTAEREMDIYEMYQTCQSGVIDLTNSKPDQTCSLIEGELIFVNEFDQQNVGNNLLLGSIRVLKEEFDPKCRPVLKDTVSIRMKYDKKAVDPVDVTVLNVNGTETLVVTDFNNKRLKSFFTIDNQSQQSSLKLSGEPLSVAILTDNQVAVSFEEQNYFVVVKVGPDLALLSKITTQKMYSCLAVLNDATLVVGCRDPPSLDLLDTSGLVQKSIKPDGIFIQLPTCIRTTTNGNILVCDDGSKSIYCLSPEGEVVFHYSPSGEGALGSPQGVTCSPTGDILLSDWSNDKVVQLTPKGDFVRDILTRDNVYSPYGCCLHKHELYVVQAKQPLKVFKVNRIR